jgi:hypothetical protein
MKTFLKQWCRQWLNFEAFTHRTITGQITLIVSCMNPKGRCEIQGSWISDKLYSPVMR